MGRRCVGHAVNMVNDSVVSRFGLAFGEAQRYSFLYVGGVCLRIEVFREA
jgi:hypothetical protein